MIIGTTNAEGLLAVDNLLGLLKIPYIFLNSGWFVEGPLLVTETWPWETSLDAIKMANEVKNYYMKPSGQITENNNGGVHKLRH